MIGAEGVYCSVLGAVEALPQTRAQGLSVCRGRRLSSTRGSRNRLSTVARVVRGENGDKAKTGFSSLEKDLIGSEAFLDVEASWAQLYAEHKVLFDHELARWREERKSWDKREATLFAQVQRLQEMVVKLSSSGLTLPAPSAAPVIEVEKEVKEIAEPEEEEEPQAPPPLEDSVLRLLNNNSDWADEVSANDPTFFPELPKGQTPEYLWIGCADSRVVANAITGTKPGELFCHRNVGNLVMHSDANCMSSLEFSVLALKVQHVVVCGHSACGAVNASLSMPQSTPGVVNCWINEIRSVRNEHAEQLAQLSTHEEKLAFMCEANAIRQAYNVCTSPAIQAAWAGGQEVAIHAVIFDLETGKLKKLAGPITSLEQAAAAKSSIVPAQISKNLASTFDFESSM